MKRCTGVESGGCTVQEYWGNPEKLFDEAEALEQERFDAQQHLDDLHEHKQAQA